MRKTKIIATIGPTSRNRETLDQLIAAGMDCARLNFSHGSHEDHGEVINLVRELSQKHGRPVAILQDLGGIKMRLGEIDGLLQLNRDDEVTFVPETYTGQSDVIPFPQPRVISSLRPGHQIFVADGSVRLEVMKTDGEKSGTRPSR